MQQIKWKDRKFHFGYEKGYVPLFIERLNTTAPRLEELFGHTNEQLASSRQNGGWSAKEHAGHLSDLEALHDGRIDDYMAGLEILRPADMNNKATYEANHNGKTLPDILSIFRASRNNFMRRIGSLDELYFERKALHPRLQQMITITDLLFFIAEHDNNHLTKIASLLK